VLNGLIATPFNKAGFQMNPTKGDCERALSKTSCLPRVIINLLRPLTI
jgi:hypothetical protein